MLSYIDGNLPGPFQAPIDGIEIFFPKINSTTPQLLEVGTVKGLVTMDHSFDAVSDRLRNAWITLQYDHPSLATKIMDEKTIY
jgi:hypothetical protein